MAITISTKSLQAMAGKLSKCSTNKLLEITKYWHLVVTDKGFEMTAMDGSNYITAKDPAVKGSLDAIVRADQFGKLIDKTSVDKVVLELKENYLRVVGNGDYKVEIVLGETYPFYEVPEKVAKLEAETAGLKKINTYNKSAVSTTLADGYLTGYYVSGSEAVTSDSIKICINPVEVFEEPVLLTAEMMTLATALSGEKFTIQAWDNKVMMLDDTTVIYGAQLDGIEEFPDVDAFAEMEFASNVKLSKLGITAILDRLTLFLDSFDKSEIMLEFTDKTLKISTGKGSFEEIAYAEANGVEPFVCNVNVVYFKDIVSAVQNEYFYLHFGEETMIEVVDGDVIFILATGEMEEEGEE